jgi:hypothetical protein
MKSTRSLDKLFDEAHEDLAILVTRTRQLMRWTALFRAQIDNELAPHCYLSNIQDRTLIVYVDSAAWATRLRFQIPQLLDKLRATNPVFSNLEEVKIKVLTQSQQHLHDIVVSTGPTMSAENANVINSLSESIDDSGLRKALQELAHHATQNKNRP